MNEQQEYRYRVYEGSNIRDYHSKGWEQRICEKNLTITSCKVADITLIIDEYPEASGLQIVLEEETTDHKYKTAHVAEILGGEAIRTLAKDLNALTPSILETLAKIKKSRILAITKEKEPGRIAILVENPRATPPTENYSRAA